ncbi:MAG TPA: hypothetical protein VGM82_17110 [Gemmatimonadaceae bacterium]|jgi:hypothetical protein
MRQSYKVVAFSLSVLVAAACSDVSTSPQTSARSLSAAPAFDYSGGGRFRFGDSKTSFTVTPDGGTFAINRLVNVAFPAGAICDPDQSTYGPTEWDNACVILDHPITIIATTRLTAHGMAVDFQPNLRFSPDKQVVLSTDLFASTLKGNRSYFLNTPSGLQSLAFYYSPTLGGEGVADYVVDSTLVTNVDLENGRVWRRVKHFSGYAGTDGRACSPTSGSPDCVNVQSDNSQ